MKKSPGTICDEIKRNSFKGHHIAVYAQNQTDKRQYKARQRHPLKNKSVFKYVFKKLRDGWSPEQIAGRLKLKKPNNPYWHIHHETIYRFIYAKENKDKRLWEYLPRKQKKKRRNSGRKPHRCKIPDRVSIHKQPKRIDKRTELGHWEGDSIVGKNHKGGIHTEVERKARFIMAQSVSDLTANQTARVAAGMFSPLPKDAKKSTTIDNGSEFAEHKKIGIQAYFCDPYSSWQKGTNENSNCQVPLLLR